MTYAADDGVNGARRSRSVGLAVEHRHNAAWVRGSSSRRTPPPGVTWPSAAVSTRTGSTSRNNSSIRPAGWSGANGTYTAPAFSTASMATTRSTDRGRTSATARSGPAPSPIR